MKNIKCINCFGTSFTAGGGFEFDGTFPFKKSFREGKYFIV